MKFQHILARADEHVAASTQTELLEPEGLLFNGLITLR